MTTERPTGISAMSSVAQAIRGRVRTMLYGNVVSYDPAQRRAKVQPGRMQRAGATLAPMPVTPAIPVAWPRWAGMVIEGRLNPGDPVLVAVCDRELSPWIDTGSAPVPPRSNRRHSIADAVVLAGILPTAQVPAAGPPNPAELWIGKAARTTGIAIQIDGVQLILEAPAPGGIRLGRTAASPIALSPQLMAYLQAWVASWVVVALDGGASLKTTAAAFLATGIPAAGPTAWSATKVLAE